MVRTTQTGGRIRHRLQVRLESTTSFTTRLREGVKLHEHVLLQLANANEQKVAEIDQSFALERKRISAETERYEIQMDEQLAAAKSDRTVQIETARGAMKVAMTEARGEVEVAAFDARTRKTDVVASARIRCDKDLQEAKHVCMVEKTEAEGRKEAAEFLAKARVAEARADGEVAKKTALKIKHEHTLRLAEIDAKIAGEGRKLLSGEAGAKILSSLVSVRSELIER